MDNSQVTFSPHPPIASSARQQLTMEEKALLHNHCLAVVKGFFKALMLFKCSASQLEEFDSFVSVQQVPPPSC